MSCLFSVIIPTRNRNACLSEAVACASAQTLPPCEILVVDNSDFGAAPLPAVSGSATVLRAVAAAGPGQARNMAAVVARGQYLAFLDDDDLWESGYLEKMSGLIAESEPDMLLARVDRLRDGEIRPYRCPPRSWEGVNLFRDNPGITGSSIVARRDAFLRAGGFDARLMIGEDKMLVASFLQLGLSVLSAPHVQSLYRVHQTGRLTDKERIGRSYRLFAELLRPRMTPADYRYIRKRGSGMIAKAYPGFLNSLAHILDGLWYAWTRLRGR